MFGFFGVLEFYSVHKEGVRVPKCPKTFNPIAYQTKLKGLNITQELLGDIQTIFYPLWDIFSVPFGL